MSLLRSLSIAALFILGMGAAPAPQLATATFAGGCFWCMQPPFEKLHGVVSVKAGYTGGSVKNPRMTDYIVPTALDAPPFTTILVEAPFSAGPGGGAKGLGELPMDGGAPAIAAAVEHATGIVADGLPLLPEELLVLAAAQEKLS